MGSAGDLNGDGFGDFFVTSPNTVNPDGTKGEIEIYYGGLTQITEHGIWSESSGTTNFGRNVCSVADFNDDGYSDLAHCVGRKLFILAGAPGLLDDQADYEYVVNTPLVFVMAHTNDINKDGYGDVLACIPGYDEGGSTM